MTPKLRIDIPARDLSKLKSHNTTPVLFSLSLSNFGLIEVSFDVSVGEGSRQTHLVISTSRIVFERIYLPSVGKWIKSSLLSHFGQKTSSKPEIFCCISS